MQAKNKLFLFFLVPLAFVMNVEASKWNFNGSLAQEVKYDTNFFLSEEELETWSYITEPKFDLTYATAVTSSTISAAASVNLHDNLSQFNNEDYDINWVHAYTGNRWSWGLDAAYGDAETRREALEDSGDFTGGAQIATTSLEPNVLFKLSEKNNLFALLSYVDNKYSAGEFTDNTTFSWSFGWGHTFSQKFAMSVALGDNRFEATSELFDIQTDYKTINLGLQYKLSPELDLSATVGFFDSKSQLSTSFEFEPIDPGGSGSLVELMLNYRSLRLSWDINASKNLSPSSQGEVLEADRVSFTTSYELSERSLIGCSAQWGRNTSKIDPEREYVDLEIFYAYDVAKSIELKASYKLREQERDANTMLLAESFDGSVGSFSLRYKF